jgi:hypothetical protein
MMTVQERVRAQLADERAQRAQQSALLDSDSEDGDGDGDGNGGGLSDAGPAELSNFGRAFKVGCTTFTAVMRKVECLSMTPLS